MTRLSVSVLRPALKFLIYRVASGVTSRHVWRALASRKSPYSKTQSANRNLIWSDSLSSFPTIRCGGTPSTMQTRIVPVTLATDTEGVTKAASTGVRSSAYFLNKDSASSKVIFTGLWNQLGVTLGLFLLRLHLGPSRTLCGCDSPAPCCGDPSLWFLCSLLLCPTRFLCITEPSHCLSSRTLSECVASYRQA